jgi:predicted ATPase
MRLEKLRIKNFKAFADWTEIQIKPITILYGWNSAGKSSVGRLLVWLSQSFSRRSKSPLFLEDKSIFSDQGYGDLVSFGVTGKPISIELHFNGGSTSVIIAAEFIFMSEFNRIVILNSQGEINGKRCYQVLHNSDFTTNVVHNVYVNEQISQLEGCQFVGFIPYPILGGSDVSILPDNEIMHFEAVVECLAKINYLGPHRADVLANYPISGEIEPRIGYEGDQFRGSYAPRILYADAKIHGGLLRNVSDAFEKVFNGSKLQIAVEASTFKLLLKSENSPAPVNFRNVGEGMIQALPFITMCFLTGYHLGSINIIEQPELHLHPAAHGNLMDLFIGSSLRQENTYFIETHSENILIRLRRRIAEGSFSTQDVAISWVEQTENGNTLVRPIVIDPEGEVDFWPDGVFSEDFQEVVALRQAQMARGEVSNDI